MWMGVLRSMNVCERFVSVFHTCLCKDSLNYFLNGPSYSLISLLV